MGATEEQISFLSQAGVTHVSYILLIFSAAFLMFLFVNVLLHIYAQACIPLRSDNSSSSAPEGGIQLPVTPLHTQHSRSRQQDLERARAAEEYELDGLMSEDEEERPSSADGVSEDSGSGRRKEALD